MTMEHLSNELFRLIQMLASRAIPKLLSITRKKGETAAARCAFGSTWTIHTSTGPQTSSTPLSWKRCSKVAERKERLPTILWNFGICDKDRVSRNAVWHYHKPDNWTSPSALFPSWLECQHPWWICLHSSVSVATNYFCFVSTILCFYNHFFNVSINNIVVANAACSLGGGLYM